MGVEQEIGAIREGIKTGRFSNEAAVSQGIVLRLLTSLSWPTYDTQIIWPEYSLSGRRVDFALCHPPGKPIAIIEVKQIGQSDGAERQLFEYAFHNGVPMAILTDGREWNFFLPGEQGDYSERRVYKLDIVERDATECAERLLRYLEHNAVVSGAAIQAARDDYRNVSRERQMKDALPNAWSKLIQEEDEMLLEILADHVESFCGFKPDPDMCARFLRDGMTNQFKSFSVLLPTSERTTTPGSTRIDNQPLSTPTRRKQQEPIALRKETGQTSAEIGFTLDGKFHSARNAIDVLLQVFEELTRKDSSFPERFAGLPRHGKSRRYLARDASELYPNRLDLCRDHSVQLNSGWHLSTNHSRQTIARIIEMGCEVAHLRYRQDLEAHLGA